MFKMTKNSVLCCFIKKHVKKYHSLVRAIDSTNLHSVQSKNSLQLTGSRMNDTCLFHTAFRHSSVISSKVSVLNACPLSMSDFVSRVIARCSSQSVSDSSFVLTPSSTLEDALSLCNHALKTNSPITSNETIKIIISKVCERDDLTLLDLSNVLKVIHFSKCKRHLLRNDIFKLLEYCNQISERFSLQSYTHLCNLMSSCATYVPHLLDKAFHKLRNELSTARTKDMERLVTCLAYFNHQPSSELNEVVEEFISRNEELENFPIIAYSMMGSLCVFGVYPRNLIKRCFDEECINRLLEMKYEIGSVLVTVNTSFKIECYGECENLLLNREIKPDIEPVTINELLQKQRNQDRLSNTENEIIRCFSLMKHKFGDKVICKHLLPYLPYPDIVIVDRPSVIKRIGLELRPSMIHGCTVVIIKHQNNYSDSYCKQIKGWHSLKTRLLSTIGYKIIEISYNQLKGMERQFNLNMNRC